jgi:dTDP-4-amino-4,6-dideoxygalactose transaminase
MIPLVDLKAQHQSLKSEIAAAVQMVLENTQFVLGEQVAAFEREFAHYCGGTEGIGVNSGTSALHLALLAAGVGPGDEVITVPFTFVATAAAIGYTGATPVFVDIDPETFTMDPRQLADAITPRTKCIIPVHLYGHAADMDPILEIANDHGIVVIEDACQAHGTRYKGRRVGSIGTMGCFSFYPGKNLGACGEGGMVVTNDPSCAKKMRMLRDWGQERKYHHELKGYNYRLEGLQGSILRIKLAHLDDWTAARRRNARQYRELLADTDVITPNEAAWTDHVYHVYAVRTADRDGLQRRLLASGVQTGIHYPIPVHLQPAWAELGYHAGDFPESEKAAREVLSLPMYPELSATQIDVVAAAVFEHSMVP